MRLFRLIGIPLGLLALLSACSLIDEETGGEPNVQQPSVPVNLSVSLASHTPDTKGNQSQLTELADEGGFRGMENVVMIPFASSEAVQAGDVSIGSPRQLPSIGKSVDDFAFSNNQYHTGIIRNNHAHFYPDAYAALPRGTRTVLVYGKAPAINLGGSEQSTKHLNGSLIDAGLGMDDEREVSDITFSPDPIFVGGTPTLAGTLADILTSVAQSVSYTQAYYYKQNEVSKSFSVAVTWNDRLAEPVLQEYYQWFTGEGELMTGAGVSVEYLLSSLYGRLKRFESDDEEPFMHMAGGVEYPAYLDEDDETSTFTYARLYNGLRDQILLRFQSLLESQVMVEGSGNTLRFVTSAYREYPVGLGVPAGAAVLRWNGTRYVVVTEGLDGISAIDRYCYTPSLYYYVNSPISTSSDPDLFPLYTYLTESWSQILSQYRQGTTVLASTRSVALDKPLQYAPGKLRATLRATASLLPDNDGDARTNCSVTGTNFPVTGILIGSQYMQNYDFTPDPVGEKPEYYLYDNLISGIYLTTTASSPFYTLVFPTPLDQDVYFFLELRNDSGSVFSGADGLIIPGNYFYLAGKLSKNKLTEEQPRVFMSDHITSADFVVESLENARVSVPELGQPQLMLGVQTSINWTMSASSYVVLD